MSVSQSLRKRIFQQARGRCGYCLVDAEYIYALMEIDHIHPQSKGGSDDESNLWLACPRCNGYKQEQTDAVDPLSGDRVSLFNPRFQDWREHFIWGGDDAEIVGLTPIGRATVLALKLNHPDSLKQRQRFVEFGWYPPKD